MPKKVPLQMCNNNMEGSNLMKGLAKEKCYQERLNVRHKREIFFLHRQDFIVKSFLLFEVNRENSCVALGAS